MKETCSIPSTDCASDSNAESSSSRYDLGAQLLGATELKDICLRYQSERASRTGKALGFNIFTVLSDRYYQENFHSDILASFLDMKGTHGESKLFFSQFLALLKQCNPTVGKDLGIEVFGDYETERERGRIDVSILGGETSDGRRRAIIIENKMNNAVDQRRQLPRYVDELKKKGFEVVAIVYLSMNDRRDPNTWEWTEEEKSFVESKLVSVAAYTNGRSADLYKHWLYPCMEKSVNEDAKAILKQYGQLLMHLGANVMNDEIMEDFYSLVLTGENYSALLTLRELLGQMPAFVAKRIRDKYIQQCSPFATVNIWKLTTAYFDNFRYKNSSIFVDVVCDEGSLSLQIGERGNENPANIVKEVLENAGLSREFTYERHNGDKHWRFFKRFKFPSEEHCLDDFLSERILPMFAALEKDEVPVESP